MEDENYDVDGVQVRATLDADGRELLDPVPLKPPVTFRPVSSAISLEQMVRDVIRGEALRSAAEGSDLETFEEADDFDIDDDPIDPASPWEITFEGSPVLSGASRAELLERANKQFVQEYATKTPAEPVKPTSEAAKPAGATSPSDPAPTAPVDTSTKPV